MHAPCIAPRKSNTPIRRNRSASLVAPFALRRHSIHRPMTLLRSSRRLQPCTRRLGRNGACAAQTLSTRALIGKHTLEACTHFVTRLVDTRLECFTRSILQDRNEETIIVRERAFALALPREACLVRASVWKVGVAGFRSADATRIVASPARELGVARHKRGDGGLFHL